MFAVVQKSLSCVMSLASDVCPVRIEELRKGLGSFTTILICASDYGS